MIPLTWLVSSAPFVDEWLGFPEQDSKPSTFTSTLPSPTSALINSFEDTPTSSQWGFSPLEDPGKQSHLDQSDLVLPLIPALLTH